MPLSTPGTHLFHPPYSMHLPAPVPPVREITPYLPMTTALFFLLQVGIKAQVTLDKAPHGEELKNPEERLQWHLHHPDSRVPRAALGDAGCVATAIPAQLLWPMGRRRGVTLSPRSLSSEGPLRILRPIMPAEP